MIKEILKIIINILKLNKNFFKEKKNFDQASIYFAILLILIGAVISIITNNSFIVSMSSSFDFD